jgi:alkylglycerol monooxygenase
MQEKIIALAAPVFFLLIFIELIVGILRRRNTYRLNDAINSISLRVLSQVSGVFLKLLQIGIYAWLVQHIAIFKLSVDSALIWISGLLLYDLCYYWLHRMRHEVNVLWAVRVVHHQSEDYNLSTAFASDQQRRIAGLGFLFADGAARLSRRGIHCSRPDRFAVSILGPYTAYRPARLV